MTKQYELFEEYASYNEYVPFVSEVETFNETFGKPNNYAPVIPRDEKLINFVNDLKYFYKIFAFSNPMCLIPNE